MPKILTDAQFVTMSTPAVPPTGYGSVFASGSSLFFRNATGTTFDLAAAGGGGYTIIREYTASATWTKPAGMYELLIVCVGAGGGGGSGRVAPPSTNRLGGTGGGGGAVSWMRHPASALPSQCDITIGAGGITGSASGPVQQSGSSGGAGTATTFTSGSGGATRTFASANGGSGGNGGAAGAAAGGIGGSVVSTPIGRGPWNLTGADGGPTTAAVVGNPPANNALNGSFGASGGGAAGGINASNVLQVGGSGSAVSYYGSFSGSVAGGIASLGSNGTNGVNNIGKSLLMISGSDTVFGIGSGGGGGGPGGNGGNGGNYGAGGGGGGGITTGSLSGAGGRGAGGLCILVEYY